MTRHMRGHLLLAVAWLAGATEAELAPRYARMPCKHKRLLRGRRGLTVECDKHGPMVRDGRREVWRCADSTCTGWLTGEEVHRLVTGMPAGSPDAVPGGG